MMGKIESKAMFLLWHCARADCASLFSAKLLQNSSQLYRIVRFFLSNKKAKQELLLLIVHVKLADNTTAQS
jgi:hypothetical protein